jgi:hypothetical protein
MIMHPSTRSSFFFFLTPFLPQFLPPLHLAECLYFIPSYPSPEPPRSEKRTKKKELAALGWEAIFQILR